MCTRSAAGIHASCVFIACKQEGVPRTFNEFVPLANAPKKEIGKCFKFIIRHLGVKLDGSVHASKFLHRFCNQLGMNHQDTKAATEIINAAVPKARRRPTPPPLSSPSPSPPLPLSLSSPVALPPSTRGPIRALPPHGPRCLSRRGRTPNRAPPSTHGTARTRPRSSAPSSTSSRTCPRFRCRGASGRSPTSRTSQTRRSVRHTGTCTPLGTSLCRRGSPRLRRLTGCPCPRRRSEPSAESLAAGGRRPP
mmetsp:Transcript_17120/g.40874  ORF Transcript_17120/g.40874 Transcript_17120/m.40874 type:complete len:250 (-) Transcript_17120:73-822(-)